MSRKKHNKTPLTPQQIIEKGLIPNNATKVPVRVDSRTVLYVEKGTEKQAIKRYLDSRANRKRI